MLSFFKDSKVFKLISLCPRNFVSLIIFNKIHSLIESLLIVFDRFLTIFWQTKVAKNILFDCFDSFLYTHLFVYTCIWVPIMCLIWKREKRKDCSFVRMFCLRPTSLVYYDCLRWNVSDEWRQYFFSTLCIYINCVCCRVQYIITHINILGIYGDICVVCLV